METRLHASAGKLLWWLMTKAIRLWVNNYMDQFESFRFKCDYGYDTYVSISYHSDYPDSFEDLNDPQRLAIDKST